MHRIFLPHGSCHRCTGSGSTGKGFTAAPFPDPHPQMPCILYPDNFHIHPFRNISSFPITVPSCFNGNCSIASLLSTNSTQCGFPMDTHTGRNNKNGRYVLRHKFRGSHIHPDRAYPVRIFLFYQLQTVQSCDPCSIQQIHFSVFP